MSRLLLLALLLTLSACARQAERSERRPSILLITLDTLRADRLGCYGYARPTSRHLDRFAEGATRYTRAKASAPWTLPSHATLFTGLHPFEHGAHSYEVDRAQWSPGGDPERAADNVLPLDEAFTTMAERLREAGYRTGGIVANNVFLDDRYGCTQGFEHYQVLPETADKLLLHAERWLSEGDERPFFLFLNFMDVHSPYNTASRPGWPDLGAPVESAQLLNRLNDQVLGGQAVDPAELQRLADQYDLAIANLDEQLGRLFELLRAQELFDPLLIVITSDHGEYLGEHRLIGHSKDVYEEALAIPLWIKAPQQAEGALEQDPIGLVHVLDRMAEHVDALAPLRRHRWRESAVLAENHFSRIKDLRRPWGARFLRSRAALYREDHKYIHSTDGADELFDLAQDPRELRALNDPERAAALRASLLEVLRPRFPDLASVAAPRAEGMRSLSAEEIERLKSLGYF